MITLDVHKKGQGVVGTYTKEIAESLIAKANVIIKGSEHPLQLSMEPA
jgi:ATP-dependent Clp protease adaptor protein ClpS